MLSLEQDDFSHLAVKLMLNNRRCLIVELRALQYTDVRVYLTVSPLVSTDSGGVYIGLPDDAGAYFKVTAAYS